MVLSIILMLLGVISIVYFVTYAMTIGINDTFLYIWAMLGIVLVLWGLLHRWIVKTEHLTAKRAEQIVAGIVCIGLAVFVIMLGSLIREGNKEPEKNADYVVVLGAHVFGERMSANLRYRVEAACEYLKENPQTKAVLSGGQGRGEDISEAEAMRRYLTEKGIASDRLLLDETSVNTDQNIANSVKLIGGKDKKIVIVSNDFHIYRAKRIAKKQGLQYVDGLGSKTYPQTVPNAYAREVLAVLKYKLCGQI